jgi:hypothetical protein
MPAGLIAGLLLGWLILRPGPSATPSWITLYPFDWIIPPATDAALGEYAIELRAAASVDGVPVMWLLATKLRGAPLAKVALRLHQRMVEIEDRGLPELDATQRAALRRSLILEACDGTC